MSFLPFSLCFQPEADRREQVLRPVRDDDRQDDREHDLLRGAAARRPHGIRGVQTGEGGENVGSVLEPIISVLTKGTSGFRPETTLVLFQI